MRKSIGRPAKQPRRQLTPAVSFNNDDCKRVVYPHDDALVVSMLVANYTTLRKLTNNSSSADVLLWDSFVKMGISQDLLGLALTILKGFSGEAMQPVGSIMLLISVGSEPCTTTRTIDFLVVRTWLAYGAIIGRPTLNAFRAITSTYHLKMKFPIER